MLPSKRQSVNSLIINRVNSRDSVKNMIDAGIQKSSEFLWKIYMKYNYIERRTPRLKKIEHGYMAIDDDDDALITLQ